VCQYLTAGTLATTGSSSCKDNPEDVSTTQTSCDQCFTYSNTYSVASVEGVFVNRGCVPSGVTCETATGAAAYTTTATYSYSHCCDSDNCNGGDAPVSSSEEQSMSGGSNSGNSGDSSSGVECYACAYSKAGDVTSDSQSCKEPNDDTPTLTCSGKCSKIHQEGKWGGIDGESITRSCLPICAEAEGDIDVPGASGTSKTTCCDTDKCNTAATLGNMSSFFLIMILLAQVLA